MNSYLNSNQKPDYPGTISYDNFYAQLSPKFGIINSQNTSATTTNQKYRGISLSNQRPLTAAITNQKKRTKSNQRFKTINHESDNYSQRPASIEHSLSAQNLMMSRLSSKNSNNNIDRSKMIKSLLIPNYSQHLSKSTKDLSIYNEMIQSKQREKEMLKHHIQLMKKQILQQDLTNGKVKKSCEKIDQESKKISALNYRTKNENLLMGKELENCRKEFMTANILKQQADFRKNELAKRLNEEKDLIIQLKNIVKRLNKEITNTNNDKDRIRSELIITDKTKSQLRDKIIKLRQESQLFYKRAQRNIMTN
eukprot:403365732